MFILLFILLRPPSYSLEKLELGFIAVRPGDCQFVNAPRLESLTLEYCGSGSASAGATCC